MFGFMLVFLSLPLAPQARIYGVRHPDGGSRITVLPDMDGDGIKDYVVARFLPELRRFIMGYRGNLIAETQDAIRVKNRRSPDYGNAGVIGDLDGDGIPDLYSYEWYGYGSYPDPKGGLGRFDLYFSTKKWRFVKGFIAKKGRYRFGPLGTCGDLNGDKISEFVVSWVGTRRGYSDNSYREIWDGKTFKPIKRFVSRALTGYNAIYVESPLTTVGDINKDGYPDLLDEFHYTDRAKNIGRGWIRILSGKDFKEILAWREEKMNVRNLRLQSLAGDWNRDGYPDFLLSYELNTSTRNYIFVASGKDGSVLQIWSLPLANENFIWYRGGKAQVIGDVNRDGVPDILAPFRRSFWLSHVLGYYCLSGKNPGARPLFEMDQRWVIPENASLGDVDKDGYPDFYATAMVPSSKIRKQSIDVFVFSTGKKRFRSSGTGTVSYSKLPQTLTLTMDAQNRSYLRLFVVLGSLTGSFPGISIGNQILPVEPDAYLALSLGLPGGGLIQPAVGYLQPSGKKNLTLTFPRGLPQALIGQTFLHCFLTIDMRNGLMDYASDPIKTKIVR